METSCIEGVAIHGDLKSSAGVREDAGEAQPSVIRPSPAAGLRSAILARWCRLRSYLDPAATHGISALDASATPSPENPGYRHSPPSANGSPRHPVNGH